MRTDRQRRAMCAPLPVVVLALVALLVMADPVASATLDDQLVDEAGAVEDEAAAEAALEQLRAEDNVQLWVVFVDTFGGVSAQQWTDRVAVDNGLGLNDALLAVAVDDRQYAYSVDDAFPLGDDDLARLATEVIEPQLQAGDWDGAVIAAAGAFGDALDGAADADAGDVPEEGDAAADDGGGIPTWVWLAPLLVVGAWFVATRLRRGEPASDEAPSAPVDVEPLDELWARADGLLLDTDDAIATSRNELVLAEAQFGGDATAMFRDDVDEADAQLQEAFRLRHQLNDRDPAATRATLGAMIERLDAANARLDAHVDEFDRLRDLEATAPEHVEQLDRRRHALAERVTTATDRLDQLRTRYADATLATVADTPAHAGGLLAAAAAALDDARTALSRADPSAAVIAARAAEDAIGQVDDLVAGIDRLAADLTAVDARLDELLAETRRDIDEAVQAPAPLQPQLTDAVERARAVVSAAESDRAAKRPDPLGMLRQLDAADQRLEALLVDVREASARADRARRQLDGAMGAARAEISGVEDYIRTRRGAVGPDARTRLAEAQQRLRDAVAARDADPEQALQAARDADALAEEAGRLAQDDRQRWDGGTWGDGRGAGVDIGSLVLGGILLGGRGRGGWGTGGFGGGFGGPGSFGGVATRGRRGGGSGWGGGGGRRGGGGRF